MSFRDSYVYCLHAFALALRTEKLIRVAFACLWVLYFSDMQSEYNERRKKLLDSLHSFFRLPLTSTLFSSMCKHHPNDILSSSIIFFCVNDTLFLLLQISDCVNGTAELKLKCYKINFHLSSCHNCTFAFGRKHFEISLPFFPGRCFVKSCFFLFLRSNLGSVFYLQSNFYAINYCALHWQWS